MPILALILFLILGAASTLAFAYEPIVFPSDTHRLHVSKFYTLDNRSTQWTHEAILSGQHDAAFTKYENGPTLLGIPQNSQAGDYWVRVEVDNRTEQEIHLLAEYGINPSIARVFVLNAETRETLRIHTPGERLPRTVHVYPLPTGPLRIYLEIRLDTFSLAAVNLELKSAHGMLFEDPERHILVLSYGICLALIAYNFVLALSVRHRAHVIYIAYNIAVLLYYEGRYQVLAQQFGVPELPRWSLIPINASSSFLYLLFLYYMLEVREKMPAWKWPVRGMFALCPVLVVYSFADMVLAQLALINVLILCAPLTIALGIHASLKKVPGARLLLVTAVLPGLGTIIHLLPGVFGKFLPLSVISSAQLIALDIEMVLLSMTVGFKINREQEWLRRKIQHAYAELKTIVYPHQVNQIWEGLPLGRTMPVGVENAFILVFDVVASSKMQIADPRGFLSAVFRDCSDLMMQNYQPDPLVANAYRVKEMGDGFLCSVGFPFGCPHENAADHSVELAHQFLEIFRRHVQAVGAAGRIHCAIGIAYGPVEAFYPESGAQVYDLFGRGIILAHRYESMRDILFRWLKYRDDIIILHKPVFDQVSERHRQEFVEVDLISSNFKVRDDEDATCLYYQLASGREQKRLPRGA
ncbi:7TM diverse intracellular signaling domain-containing protein [Oligoflexus tunisiensis]|uniref:7TM diverse intracellular signaling domain-containing protein n=1 Tax=Oligoflexus tunisiensis TaxID=708132 RepID=UPI00114D01F4|nr:7TM diverse intracellular signaling domain-containing protein [Oligoflexus tunisiensis]